MIDVATLSARLVRTPRGFALLDVREAGEAERGHIPGASALPRRLLEFRLATLLPDRSTPVVVYDGDDGRAALAARTLREAGCTAVERLAGGLPAWRAAGLPVATGFNVPSKAFGEAVLHEGVPMIAPEELAPRLEAGEAVVWDVRTPAEHASATLPGSTSAPSFEHVLHAVAAARNGRPLVVHCAGRTRSIIAARTLALLGVPALALADGTMGWRLAGLPLERGAERRLPAPDPGAVAEARDRAAALAATAGVVRLSAAALAERRRAGGTLQAFDVQAFDVHVFDVRGAAAFAEAHIDGAVWAPGGQLVQCTDEYVAVDTAEIVLVDDGDARALVCGYWLKRMGFAQVAVLDGGLPAWTAAGGSIATGPQRSAPVGLAGARAAATAIAAAELLAGAGRYLVVDVGTSRDFAGGHVPGARWLPRGSAEVRLAEIAAPDETVVVTARDERQAILAAAALQRCRREAGQAGAVLRLAGGNAGWQAAGGPLERGAADHPDFGRDLVEPPYAKGEEAMRRYLEWETRLAAPTIR